MKKKSLIELSVNELGKKLRETRAELLNLRMNKSSTNDKPHLFRTLRKDIARLETIINIKNKVEITN